MSIIIQECIMGECALEKCFIWWHGRKRVREVLVGETNAREGKLLRENT